MTIHLVGGGWAERPDGAPFRAFLDEAAARALAAGRTDASGRPRPRVAVIAVRADGAEHAAKLIAETAAADDFEAVVTAIPEGGEVPATAIAEVDGILVGGGLTPAYRDALEPRFGEIRRQIAAGVPYLGFSAGSAIAAERALVGGWRVGGIAVAPEDAAEDLDELTVVDGIGLVDVAIDVHAAQWGTLSRLVAAVEAGIVDGGLAIDEGTALIVGEGGLQVAGSGSVWRVLPAEHGVLVSTIGA